MTEKIASLIAERDNVIKKLAKEILDSPDIDNVEKLRLITIYNIWDIDFFIEHPFAEQTQELQERIFLETGRKYAATEDIFNCEDYPRYSTVYYIDIIDNYGEDMEEDEKITVVKARNSDLKAEVTYKEFKDILITHAFNTQKTGFRMDW